MHHQGNQAGQGIDDMRQGASLGREHHAIGLSIRPGSSAVRDTVLVAHVCDGGLLLHGWRDRPSASLGPFDATPLRCELAAAVGATQLARRSSPGDAR
jgi:hypothetical protein